MHPSPYPARFASRRLLAALVLPVSLSLPLAQSAIAADGTWNVDGAGNWTSGVGTNWLNGIAAEGADFTAYFNAVNITGNRVVTLTAPVTPITIGNLAFGDATTASHDWTLNSSGGAVLTLQTTTGTPTITVDNRTATISAALSSSQGFTKAGTGKLVLSGVHTALSGAITVNAGTLDLWDTASAYDNSINLTVSTATLDAANTVSGSVVTINGNITGFGRINKTSGVSTLVLNGNNDYSGGTTLAAGTLVAGNGTNNGIGTGTLALNNGAFRSSDDNSRTFSNVLSMGSGGLRLGGLQGDTSGRGDLTFTWAGSTSIGGSKTWTVNNATTASFNNNWTGNNGWNVTKAGTGTLVFNGNLTSTGVGLIVNLGTMTLNGSANSYTGTTTINGGTLLINGAKTGSGAVAVNSTGALGGSGSVTGAVTAASGSFLKPGASSGAVGTLTFNSGLDISGLSAGTGGLLFDLDTVGASDKISVGSLTIGTGLLNFDDFGFTTLGSFGAGVYTLFDATSIIGTLGTNLSGTIAGWDSVLSISGNDLVLTVSAIPEPASCASLAGGALFGFALSRRRRLRA